MTEEPEVIIVVPTWRALLPLAKLYAALGLLAFLSGLIRGLS